MREGQSADPGCMALQFNWPGPFRPFSRTIPDCDCCASTSGQIAASTIPGEFAHFGGIAIHLEIFTCLSDPEMHRCILISCYNVLSIGTPDHHQDRTFPFQM